MKTHKLVLTILLIGVALHSFSQRLDRFGAETGKYERNGMERRISYKGIISYFDYTDSTDVCADSINGKPVYYLYFYLPDTTAELGIRMISPVPEMAFPESGDYADAAYWKNQDKNENYFDPAIILQKAIGAYSPNDSTINQNDFTWINLAENDNSEELFEQPSNLRNNALLRVFTNKTDSLKSLQAGLYRVVYFNAKKKKPLGSFMIQFGALIPLKGMKVSENFPFKK